MSDEEAQRQAKIVAAADASDPGLADLMDAALADIEGDGLRPPKYDMDLRTALNIVEANSRVAQDPIEEVIKTYMEGQCWSLAVAHHRRFGWPIYCLGGYHDENERDDWRTISFFHVLNKHPSGVAIDARGPHDVDHLLAEWGDVEFLPLTEEQLFALFRDQGRAPSQQDIERASTAIDRYLRPRFPSLYPTS